MALSKKDKKEIEYLNFKNDIKDFAKEVGYNNIIRYMIDHFDTIEDITIPKVWNYSNLSLVYKML